MSSDQRGGDVTDTLEAGLETEPTASYSSNVPELSRGERREVARRTRLSAIVVHETVREEGERELQRHPGALAWWLLSISPRLPPRGWARDTFSCTNR